MSPAMETAAALLLASVVALLLADPASGFLPAGAAPAAKKHVPARRNNLCVDKRTPHRAAALRAPRMAIEGGERKSVALETSDEVPRGPAGAIKLTYLEINSWMWQVNGLNLLVDPLFGTLDFGVPILIQAKKRVLSDSERVMKELAAQTDCLVISQGFDDHCHPPTIQALAGLLKPSVRLVAPPSAKGVLEEHFPSSRITYILPGQSTVLSAGGRAVEIRATTGATLGPPWQQAENGFIVRPVAAEGADKAPEGGSLYYEPHLMFDDAELSKLKADVVIAPVVPQSVGPFTLVDGGARALDLAAALSASKVVTMANAEADFSGPLGNVVTEGGTLEDFLELAREKGVTAVTPEPAKAYTSLNLPTSGQPNKERKAKNHPSTRQNMSGKGGKGGGGGGGGGGYYQTPPATEDNPQIISGWEHSVYAHRNTDRYAYIGKDDTTGEPEWLDYGGKQANAEAREAKQQAGKK
eukprot:g4992.t1